MVTCVYLLSSDWSRRKCASFVERAEIHIPVCYYLRRFELLNNSFGENSIEPCSGIGFRSKTWFYIIYTSQYGFVYFFENIRVSPKWEYFSKFLRRFLQINIFFFWFAHSYFFVETGQTVYENDWLIHETFTEYLVLRLNLIDF